MLTHRWPRGGVDAILSPSRFFQFFSKMRRDFLQTKFFPVDPSLGHLFMKNFSDRTYRLGCKIREREGTGGCQPAPPPPPPTERKLTYLSNHEDDIQS